MVISRTLAAGLAGSLVLGTVFPASAADNPPQLSAGSQWQPTQGRSPEGSFSRADQIIFNQQATQNRLEQLCRNINLSGNISAGLPGGEGSVQLGVLRRLVTLPNVDSPQDLELYQVDEYSPGANLTPSIILAQRTDASVGLGIGLSFTLNSTVVRPRPFSKNCAEIKELLNVADVKVVLPPGLLEHPSEDKFVEEMAPRIAAMEDGELWSLSGVTVISAAPDVAATVGHISAGVSIGGTQNGNATLIVHRLARNHANFSLRVSHLHVFNAQGVVADIPIINLFNPSGAVTVTNVLEKVFNSAVAGQLVNYFTARFSVLRQIGGQSTQQYLISFDMDPSDPAQAAEMARMMHYDFIKLLEKTVSMATLRATEKSNLQHFQELTAEHQETFERMAALLQTDIGRVDQNHSVTLKLPVLGSTGRAANAVKNEVLTVTAANGATGQPSRELHLSAADRSLTDTGFSIPIINKTIASGNTDTKFTSFYFADDGKLQVIYTHQDAFQRRYARGVQEKLNDFRDLLAMAGSRGDPDADADRSKFQIELPEKGHDVLKSGSLAFTLSISPEGLEKAYQASADEIKKSVLRVFPIPSNDRQSNEPGPTAARIISALLQGRDQTPEQRSKALREIVADNGNSNVFFDSIGTVWSFLPIQKAIQQVTADDTHDIAYAGVMKVLLQLADPKDVSANLAISMNGAKGTRTNISVNQNDANADLLDAGFANRVRTVQPQFMDVNK